MFDIFISYANEDRDRAGQLATLLESEGWRVWWDRRIPAGRTWRSVLEDALEDARCMVVLWSEHSVKSPWVAEEAEEARRLGKTLVPIMIQRVEPPMGFRAIQAADLVEWDGAVSHPAAQLLVNDLKALLSPHAGAGTAPVRDIKPQPKPDRDIAAWFSRHWPKAAFGVFVVIAFFAARSWLSVGDTSTVLTAPPKETLETPARRLTSLSVHAPRRTLKTAESLELSLKGRYSDGSESELRQGVKWRSTNTRVATVDEHGQVKALQNGTTNIVAKVGDLESAVWTLGVEESAATAVKAAAAPKLVALNVSSSKHELVESERVALRAKARYSDNSEKYLSSGIEWEISDRSMASLNERGELVARRPGKIRIVARSEDLTSSPLTLLIKETPKKREEPPARTSRSAEVQPAPPVKTPAVTEQTRARIAAHIERAQSYREQGNYAAALAELEKARAFDAASEEIGKEIEQTRRACNAERVLGNAPNC